MTAVLASVAIIAVILATISAIRMRQHRDRQDLIDAVREAGLAMLCEQARQQSSIELQAKLSSGVLLGAYRQAAEQVLRERGQA